MAKKSSVNKNERRKALVARTKPKLDKLKAIANAMSLRSCRATAIRRVFATVAR